MIKSLHFQVIPHSQQRYCSIGDYWEQPPNSGHWEIRVSDLGDWRMNILILIHEITELAQTEAEGIPEPAIKAFDEKFEANNVSNEDEPGDCQDAPYHQQHVFAECQERLLAQRLGVNWKEYDEHAMAIWRNWVPKTQSNLKLESPLQVFHHSDQERALVQELTQECLAKLPPCPPPADNLRSPVESLEG